MLIPSCSIFVWEFCCVFCFGFLLLSFLILSSSYYHHKFFRNNNFLIWYFIIIIWFKCSFLFNRFIIVIFVVNYIIFIYFDITCRIVFYDFIIIIIIIFNIFSPCVSIRLVAFLFDNNNFSFSSFSMSSYICRFNSFLLSSKIFYRFSFNFFLI